MDCVLSKALIGALVGATLSVLSIVAIYRSSDVLHYVTIGVYIASSMLVHIIASKISRTKCSVRDGLFLYLSITFISWIVFFNLVYAVIKS
ncbi:MAG: hypothetical protein RMI56_05060 [Sulfolobales archaeon]|nr:hypothetical protein [Sulfolobales archaeon]MDW8083150.1 hypothetical protein [Sulfolobales archaeon]